MFAYCDICGDPSTYFKVVDEIIVCYSCLFEDEEMTPLKKGECNERWSTDTPEQVSAQVVSDTDNGCPREQGL